MIHRTSSVRKLEQARPVNQPRDHRAQQQPKGGGGKGPQRKSLEHFVEGDHQASEAEAGHGRIRRHDQLGHQLAHRVPGQRTHQQENDPYRPKRHKSGIGPQTIRQRRRRGILPGFRGAWTARNASVPGAVPGQRALGRPVSTAWVKRR